MSQSLTSNLLHLIFSTRRREQTITDAVRPRLHAYMAGILKDLESPASRSTPSPTMFTSSLI